MRLYPSVVVEAQSFIGVKIVTVPMQSMSLREIIKRFVRRESLPLAQDGIYAEGLGDLEKFSREDIVVRHERAEQAAANATRIKSILDKGLPVESPSVSPPPPGAVTGGAIVGQAPPGAHV